MKRAITGINTMIRETRVGEVSHRTETTEVRISSLLKLISSPEHIECPVGISVYFKPDSEDRPYGAGAFWWRKVTIGVGDMTVVAGDKR